MNIRPYLWMRIVLYIGFLIIIFGAFYDWRFSMDIASDQEHGSPNIHNTSILIATQGSEFKNSLCQNIIDHYQSRDYYLKVTDVTKLGSYSYSEWDVIFIHHTWEINRPPKEVRKFINDLSDHSKLVVYGTSGNGRLAIKNIDAISGSSMMNEIPMRTKEVVSRIDKILESM